jgi:hypothetical protein
MNAYARIEDSIRGRLKDLTARGQAAAVRARLARTLYTASVLRIRPRAIDRYIDYFGDGMLHQPSR